MNKKYYFLAGLPRSGNTLLASIINQNKNITITPNSYVSEIIFRIENIKTEMQGVSNFPDLKSFDNVNNNVFHNYYSHWNSKYIIDRSCWGTPYNLQMLKSYCPNDIKIIVLFRDLDEILASFVRWSQNNPKNFLEKFSSIEDKCDFLMNPEGQIMKQLYSYNNLLNSENRKYAIFINYKELVNDSKNTISKIYDFLNLEEYNHQYKDLSQIEINSIKYIDDIYGKNLHKVKSNNIELSNYCPTDYIPQNILNKYQKYNPIQIK